MSNEPSQVLVDRVAQLLGMTQFCENTWDQARALLEYSHSKGWVNIGLLKEPDGSWDRVLEQAKKFQELEALLWSKERISRERETLAWSKVKDLNFDLNFYKAWYERQQKSILEFSSEIRELKEKKDLKEEPKKKITLVLKIPDRAKRRIDKRAENYWKEREKKYKLNSFEEFQKEWNFIEADYSWEPSNNGLDIVNPAFAFDTKLAKYLVYEEQDMQQKQVEEKDFEVDDSNVIDLTKFKRAGTDNSASDDSNWLWGMPDGCVFMAKAKRVDIRQPVNPMLQVFTIFARLEYKGMKNVKLLADLNEPPVQVWVDSDEYCKHNVLAGIINDPNDYGTE